MVPDEINSGIRIFEQQHGSGEYGRLYRLTIPWYWRFFLSESQLCDKIRFKEELERLNTICNNTNSTDDVSMVSSSTGTCIIS